MADERDKWSENDEPGTEETDVEAHKWSVSDEGADNGEDADVEAHQNLKPKYL